MLLQDDVNHFKGPSQQIGQAILNSQANASVLQERVGIPSGQSLQGVNETSIRLTTASSRRESLHQVVRQLLHYSHDWHHVCRL